MCFSHTVEQGARVRTEQEVGFMSYGWVPLASVGGDYKKMLSVYQYFEIVERLW